MVIERSKMLVLAGLALLLVACERDSLSSVAPLRVPELIADMWNEFVGGPGTACADGSDYKYYVYPGSENKLVIDFQGGGACWDSLTCSLPISDPTSPEFGVYQSRVFGAPEPQGISNKTADANPVKDWYHVAVSYCTADIHLGDSTQTYTNPDGTERTVQHKGQVNAQAALDWVFESFDAPETIFVTGCSAGAYGSIAYTPQIRARYPDADIYQLGDCGAGVSPRAFFDGEDGVSRWNTERVLAELVPGLELEDIGPQFTNKLYGFVGTRDADFVSQYNSALDSTQIFFYTLQQDSSSLLTFDPAQGVAPRAALEWVKGLVKSLLRITFATRGQFASYTSLLDDDDDLTNGTEHCIITKPEFYTLETDGVSFVSWVDDLVNGRSQELRTVSPFGSALALRQQGVEGATAVDEWEALAAGFSRFPEDVDLR